ncbi:hypothetical protein EVAR_4320_1 [Eumeta japonica]|uniref:Uncharacterized protein n=1 Tax=Eumeta variegata TaxID=151549 RepID=A0A4C1VBK9_EUMVA|nr:hypothetical protein EVAR_4320_1 [Eumeta japonica]
MSATISSMVSRPDYGIVRVTESPGYGIARSDDVRSMSQLKRGLAASSAAISDENLLRKRPCRPRPRGGSVLGAADFRKLLFQKGTWGGGNKVAYTHKNYKSAIEMKCESWINTRIQYAWGGLER